MFTDKLLANDGAVSLSDIPFIKDQDGEGKNTQGSKTGLHKQMDEITVATSTFYIL